MENLKWAYYEIDFFRPEQIVDGVRPVPYCEEGPNKADADYSIVIKATRKPSVEEAEQWLKSDMARLDEAGVLQVVGPCTREDVEDFYDMDGAENWPIFGHDTLKPFSITLSVNLARSWNMMAKSEEDAKKALMEYAVRFVRENGWGKFVEELFDPDSDSYEEKWDVECEAVQDCPKPYLEATGNGEISSVC